MYDPIIYQKISLLGHVIDDIKQLEADMCLTADPSLLLEYKEEMHCLVEELNAVSFRCIALIEVYLNACRETNEPILLDYYRVYKELTKAIR